MSKVDFQYNGGNTVILCNETDTTKEIINRFSLKSLVDKTKIFFSYNGISGSQFNQELTFAQMANSVDKNRKEMTIIVNDLTENSETNQKIIKSKNVICPTCKESTKIEFKNYQITLSDCKNNHKINNVSFDEFERGQNIDLSSIKCNKCTNKSKFDSYNKQFYKCCTCNINLCLLCKSNHDTNHIVLEYDEYHYKCGKHKETYTKYCKNCKKNICMLCENEGEHTNHNNIYLGDLLPNKNELKNRMNAFNEKLNKFNKHMNEIIDILNTVKNNVNEYSKINSDIINNYEDKYRNFETLYNLKRVFNNDEIIKDINYINDGENINDKFNRVLNIFYKVTNKNNINNIINSNNINNINNNNNEIKLTLNVKAEDINKQIFFLDNTKGQYLINGENQFHQHDFLEELILQNPPHGKHPCKSPKHPLL